MENKKRLVDANKLIDFIDVGHLHQPGELCWSELDVANLLLNAPTVDAVEVVRCRECKYHKDTSVRENKHCSLTGNPVEYDDFCSYGERKDCSE